MRALAHISDLHLGRGARWDAAAVALRDALLRSGVDHVVVTGDLTNRGRAAELARFRAIFAPFDEGGRITVVPGNHDRIGDDAAASLAPTGRVAAEERPGLFLVRVDSTGPQNRWLVSGQGTLTRRDVARAAALLDEAPRGTLRCLLLHHHLRPLPEEGFGERLSSWLRRPWAEELPLGGALLRRLAGRCDLVLHGHRHRPAAQVLGAAGAPPLGVYNAGASPELGRFRVFLHEGGLLVRRPIWLETGLAAVPRAVPAAVFDAA